MFDFLLSEVWWIETIIAALITGVLAFIAAIFGLRPMLEALGKQLETHNKDSEGRKGSLSKEHDGLSKTLDNLTGTVVYLKDERLKELGQREALRGQELEAQKALSVLEAALSITADLKMQLAAAQQENAALKQERHELRARIQHLEHPLREQEPEFDGPEL